MPDRRRPAHGQERRITRDQPAPRLRRAFAGRLPHARPGHLTKREWTALSAVVKGQTLAEVSRDLGISRQRVHELIEQARAKLDL